MTSGSMTRRRTAAVVTSLCALALVFALGVPSLSASTSGTTEIVSVSSTGTPGIGPSGPAAISGDGRYVAFASSAANLVPGGTVFSQIYVHDTETGETEIVSAAENGTPGNFASQSPSISSDGRYIAFESFATDLVSGLTISGQQVYVRDMVDDQTWLVSVNSDGIPAGSASGSPSISGDGRFVAFQSSAFNLVDEPADGWQHIYIHDRIGEVTWRATNAPDGSAGNGNSFQPSMNADGQYVAFASDASNLIVGDTNDVRDVFVYDNHSGLMRRVSVDSDGSEADQSSNAPSISADGRYVAFESNATNLTGNELNGVTQVYRHDTITGQTTLVSVDDNGDPALFHSERPSISADGQYVVFDSSAMNLVPEITNTFPDVFLHDIDGGQTRRVSVASNGAEANQRSDWAAISGDGQRIAFQSDATNLVSDETFGRQVYLHTVGDEDIVENTPPVVTVPNDLIVEASGPDGATVDFADDVSAEDDIDGPLTPTCAPAPGGTFPLATTEVTCSATNSAGLTGEETFLVTVVDTTPPSLIAPDEDIEVMATSQEGAIVEFDVTADDLVDGDPSVSCQPASGSLFPVGSTVVECGAIDFSGNDSTATFSVVVLPFDAGDEDADDPDAGSVEDLIDLLSDMDDVANGIKNARLSQLEAAQRSLERGSDRAACNQLNAFANSVAAQAGKHLTEEQAIELIEAAESIRVELGC